MILLLDNYDSFSYNLVQMMGSIQPDIRVVRNDKMTVEEILAAAPTHLVLSPGPGYPKDAGIMEEAIVKLKGKLPILGVCLGHQAICEAFGGTIAHAGKLMHGKQSDIGIESDCPLFKGLPSKIKAARYHSLSAVRQSLPGELRVVAADIQEGEVMAVQHKEYPIYGLQFHPESILTPDGKRILENFLAIE